MRGVKHSLPFTALVFGILCQGIWPARLVQAQAGPRLIAGPTYTSTDGTNGPRFPGVDVIFEADQADGTPIAVKAGDLKLFSIGKEVAAAASIQTFEETGYGITSILALDASGSMRGAPIAAIHTSIARFVDQARKQDLVEVITFADQTQVEVPFGAARSSLTNELQTVQPRGHFTHLYDGLLDAMVQFNHSQPKRRQLVVISDGHDEGSRHQAEDVVFRAKSLGVVINAIGLTSDSGQYLPGLKQMAQLSGGTYGRAYTTADLDNLIKQGIRATRMTPVASFNSVNLAADNKLHPVQLHWISGGLSSPAFVQSPMGKPSMNLWVLGLGGCFMAGLILLVLSITQSRHKQASTASNLASASDLVSLPPAASPPARSPIKPAMAQRAPTLPDVELVSNATPPASKRAHTVPERSKTQLAVFFDAPAHGTYAWLKFRSGGLAGESVPVNEASFAIGAIEGNNLVLADDDTISSHHARLLWEGAVLKIEDLHSTNGTFVNGVRLTTGRHLLKPGDEIRVGQTVMKIEKLL
jgi:Mg-chelatase subunit ChlD